MIECTIRYYFKSQQNRIVRFERTAHFAAVPFKGSLLDLKDDCLTVEQVYFCEDSAPTLIVQDAIVEDDVEMEGSIKDMLTQGWQVVSDARKTSH